tara:strand:- start:525 stop:872 length:348 start_codon:yes stop_codon:yes gene_type:complete
MTDAQRLFGVRLLHTTIYGVMATASLLVLYGGISGARGTWLTVAVGLVVIEGLVFSVSGLKCPLTAVAVQYGAGRDGLFDTFLPERFTRHTFRIFGPMILLGLALLAVRQWWAAA